LTFSSKKTIRVNENILGRPQIRLSVLAVDTLNEIGIDAARLSVMPIKKWQENQRRPPLRPKRDIKHTHEGSFWQSLPGRKIRKKMIRSRKQFCSGQ